MTVCLRQTPLLIDQDVGRQLVRSGLQEEDKKEKEQEQKQEEKQEREQELDQKQEDLWLGQASLQPADKQTGQLHIFKLFLPHNWFPENFLALGPLWNIIVQYFDCFFLFDGQHICNTKSNFITLCTSKMVKAETKFFFILHHFSKAILTFVRTGRTAIIND